MVPVAPRHVVAILEPGDPRVVRVLEPLLDLVDATVGRDESDRLVVDLPFDPVVATTGVEIHDALPVVDPENTGEPVPERHDR